MNVLNAMTWCEWCDDQTPDISSLASNRHEMHRAGHEIWRAIVESWAVPVVRWLARWMP